MVPGHVAQRATVVVPGARRDRRGGGPGGPGNALVRAGHRPRARGGRAVGWADRRPQARALGVRFALGFAVPTILLVTILFHLTVRRLLGQPLTAILRTMEATAGGDLRARTTTIRRDELGTIATRLNEMLDQLERFNR